MIPIKAFGVSVVVLRRTQEGVETLILKRNSAILKDRWCQVAGSAEDGETAVTTALRELKEETGLVPNSLYSTGYCEQFFQPAVNAIEVAPAFVAFVNSESDVVLNEEHSEFKWVRIEEVDRYFSTPNQCEMFAYVRKYFVERDPSQWLAEKIHWPDLGP